MSKFIPNSFQTPNLYVDGLMHLLDPYEYKVLIYAVRRIFGFNKRQDRISLSQFCDGVSSSENEQLDFGTNLNLATVKRCLSALTKYNILVKLADNNPQKNDGTLYALQLDSEKVDWEGLEDRAIVRKQVSKARLRKARKARATPIVPHTPVCGTTPPPVCGTTPPPVCGTEGHVSSRNTVETQIGESGISPSVPLSPPKKPRKKSERQIALVELETAFSKKTNIPLPKRNTARQKKSGSALWWGPLGEIWELAEKDTQTAVSLVEEAVDKMRSDRLTISSPKSVLSVAISIHANGHNGSGIIEL